MELVSLLKKHHRRLLLLTWVFILPALSSAHGPTEDPDHEAKELTGFLQTFFESYDQLLEAPEKGGDHPHFIYRSPPFFSDLRHPVQDQERIYFNSGVFSALFFEAVQARRANRKASCPECPPLPSDQIYQGRIQDLIEKAKTNGILLWTKTHSTIRHWLGDAIGVGIDKRHEIGLPIAIVLLIELGIDHNPLIPVPGWAAVEKSIYFYPVLPFLISYFQVFNNSSAGSSSLRERSQRGWRQLTQRWKDWKTLRGVVLKDPMARTITRRNARKRTPVQDAAEAHLLQSGFFPAVLANTFLDHGAESVERTPIQSLEEEFAFIVDDQHPFEARHWRAQFLALGVDQLRSLCRAMIVAHWSQHRLSFKTYRQLMARLGKIGRSNHFFRTDAFTLANATEVFHPEEKGAALQGQFEELVASTRRIFLEIQKSAATSTSKSPIQASSPAQCSQVLIDNED